MDPLELLARVPMPPNIAALPRNERGYPMPFFTPDPATLDEASRHKAIAIADHKKVVLCWKQNLCWVCGKKMWHREPMQAGGYSWAVDERAFLGGPKAFENRAYTDLPMHEACAEYSAKVCPMLTNPRHHYSKLKDMPEGTRAAAGMIMRHPVVIVMPIASGYEVVQVGRDLFFRPEGVLRVRYFHLGSEVTSSQAEEILKGVE